MQEHITKSTITSVKHAVRGINRVSLFSCIVAAAILGAANNRVHSAKADRLQSQNGLVSINYDANAALNGAKTHSSSSDVSRLDAPTIPADFQAETTSNAAGQLQAPTLPNIMLGNEFDVQIETRHISIPFRSYYQMSEDIAPGAVKDGKVGEDGVLEKKVQVFYKKGVSVKSNLISQKVIKEPLDHIVYCGIRTRGARALPSRGGSFSRVRDLNMIATGYSPREGSGTGRCKTGMRAGYGVVAVDPRVIPLHSKLYIEGYGYAVAGDTGGAIKRNRIDLGHTTRHEAAIVGKRKVHVYVLQDK